MQALPDLSKQSHEQKDELIRLLWDQVQRLSAQVAELQARLTKDSHNSHKPPSSDGLKKTTSLRGASGKAPGGQAGHKGSGLKRASAADTVIDHRLPERCVCGARLVAL